MAEKVRISQRVVYSNGLFTPLTRTRQVSCRPCEHNIVDATKLSSLVRIGGVNKLLVANCKLGRDKTKLYCRRCEHNWWQDKTRQEVLSRPRRQCEQATNHVFFGVTRLSVKLYKLSNSMLSVCAMNSSTRFAVVYLKDTTRLTVLRPEHIAKYISDMPIWSHRPIDITWIGL